MHAVRRTCTTTTYLRIAARPLPALQLHSSHLQHECPAFLGATVLHSRAQSMRWLRLRGGRRGEHDEILHDAERVTIETYGEFGTTDYAMYFKRDGAIISPWHDIPLEAGDTLYTMLTEIPKMTRYKMEVATKVEGNPIIQDVKKGKMRMYHGPIFWNYGCLPRTWENPLEAGGVEVRGAKGDNDPLDVVEIGRDALSMGSLTAVKPLGVLSMIDDGELDWKLIAISACDEHAAEINDINDIERFYPGTVSGIREWFRWYKTPDGKPVNAFGHGERALGREDALRVIKETHAFYLALRSGKVERGKLWVPEA